MIENRDPNVYWAAQEGRMLREHVRDRERRWYAFVYRRGYVDMWLSMLAEYYGIQPSALLGFDAASVGLEGDQGELVRFRVNEIRSYIRLAVTTATKQRPAFQAVTTAVESASERQVDVCESVIEAIYRSWYGEQRERRLVERGELFATMWTWLQWDEEGGEPRDEHVTLPDGTPTPQVQSVPTPAILAKILPPWQVFVDPTIEDESELLWCIVRERRSRWEMLALYGTQVDPETGEEVVDEELTAQIKAATVSMSVGHEALFGFDDGEITDDDVIVTHFYHKASRALPTGRYLCLIGDAVCADGPMRGPLPTKRYQPGEFVGNGVGYSDSWDLVVINQMGTQLTSDMATNLSTFGRQSVVADKGTEFDEDQLANGMYLIRKPVGADAPAPLQLATLPAGGQWFLAWLDKKMDSIAGQNSVTRGDPSSNIKSGTMAALFASIAQDYQAARQAELDRHRESIANLMLDMIRANAPDVLVLEMAGTGARVALDEFRAETFRVIRRVRLRPVPAALRTRAGQIEVANFLKDVPGAIQTPEQAIEIITTGQVTPLYRATRSALERVRWENEKLSGNTPVASRDDGADPATGMPRGMVEYTPEVPVLETDNPFLHVPEHNAELANPAIASDPRRRHAIMVHIEEHMRWYLRMPPPIAAFLRIPPPPSLGGPPSEAKDKQIPNLKTGDVTKHAADPSMSLPEPAKPPEPTLQ